MMPSRRLQRTLWVLMSLVSMTMCATNFVHAKPSARGNGEEQELLKLIRSGKLIRARELSEKLLAQNAESMIARYALAHVFYEEEANLPRALHHMRQAERVLVKYYGEPPRDAEAQTLHRLILFGLESILGEMDRRLEQIEIVDRYSRFYHPSLDHRKIWPLMKLHRFDEAARIATAATQSSILEERISGYNGLLSIEFERERPLYCFQEAMKAVEATAYRSCILNLNTAEAAFAVFKFSEAERLALKSMQASMQDCPSSAHTHLANLYLLRGDFRRAISAVKEAREQAVHKRIRQQFEMWINAWMMRLFYSLDQVDRAHDYAQQILRAPDRVGLISYSRELMEAIYTTDYYAIAELYLEHLRERASARSIGSKFKLWYELKTHEVQQWLTKRKIGRLIAEHDLLRGLIRPYMKPLPPWNTATLLEIVGNGIVTKAMEQISSTDEMKQELHPYFNALYGEMAYRDGDLSNAIALAKKTIETLPSDEVLLKGRVYAWGADALWRLGQRDLALTYFHHVLEQWPTAFKIMRVRLPVTVKAGSSSIEQTARARLEDSPRLQEGNSGFVVDISQPKGDLLICLLSSTGRRFGCGSALMKLHKLKRNEARDAALSDEEKVELAIDAFHELVFAPMIDLTQQDMRTLDGSAVKGRADEVLEEVFGK